jgi:ectoine hydroxylase-related dioxygenase (phytanoyl-CoA dioxygenase family)
MSEKIYEFNIEKFNFEFLIKKIFNTEKDLENFHLLLPENERIEEVNFENDNETWFHKKFYEKLNNSWDEFDILYHSFVEENIKPIFKPIFKKEKIIYQKRPTFRIQLPNNKSVGEFHRDYDYNHQLGEINFVVALTDMKDTTAIWAESIPGLGDIHPLNVEKGNFLAFNGNMCTHGNKINNSNKTRVSFDFRVISEEFYKSDFDKKSTGKSIPMTIGGYYVFR